MKHQTFPTPFPDEFNIGQAKVAKIHLEMAKAEMAETYLDAFQLGYVNDEWRAMKRRLFASARKEHDRATAILEAIT